MATLTRANGTAIRAHRERQRMTRRQLARIVGCHPDHLSNIELGHRNASLALLDKIAAALGVDPAEISTCPGDDH